MIKFRFYYLEDTSLNFAITISIILGIVFSNCCNASSLDTLTLVIKNVSIAKGNLKVNLCNQNGYKKPIQSKVGISPDTVVTLKFTGITKGSYAITAWQDKNLNGKLDYFFIGIPSENFGYSNNVRGRYGPPSFKKTHFNYSGKDSTIIIYLGNYFYNPTDHDSLSYKNTWVFAPFSGYTPETSVLVGLTGARLFRFKGTKGRSSLVDLFAIYTFDKQTIIEQSYTLFSNHDKWMGQGYSKFQNFPQYYYGVGNNLPLSNKELISYSEIKLEHVLMRRVIHKLFAGVGFAYVNIFDVHQPADGALATEKPAGHLGSQVSGLIWSASLDTRDNVYNSFKGHLIRFRYNPYRKYLGSQYNFDKWELDARKFITLSHRRNDVFAFQLYFLATTGNPVWNEIGALGGMDLMRGYYSGRYRDNVYFASQAEYRLPLTKMFGLVTFVGLGDVSHSLSTFGFNNLKPSYGAGLRVRIDNKEKLNLRIDYGIGKHTSNFYITVAESF